MTFQARHIPVAVALFRFRAAAKAAVFRIISFAILHQRGVEAHTMVRLNSHLDGYATLDSFVPLPPGEYPVRIVGSQLRGTRSGGGMLRFAYTVTEGKHRGCRIFDHLNLWHANPMTVEFAMRRLKRIAVASGWPDPDYIADSTELHGRGMLVRVTLRHGEDGVNYQVITAYGPLSDTPPRRERSRSFLSGILPRPARPASSFSPEKAA